MTAVAPRRAVGLRPPAIAAALALAPTGEERLPAVLDITRIIGNSVQAPFLKRAGRAPDVPGPDVSVLHRVVRVLMRLLVPFGPRPEIVKLAPVVAALRHGGHDVPGVATRQHHDPRLADRFFAELGLDPDERWLLPRNEPARVGTLLGRAYETIDEQHPDAVLLLRDASTVPLVALAARRYQVPVVHLEAGPRSFNERSLEEVNRRTVAAMTSLHLAPTTMAAGFPADESVPPSRVEVVGNYLGRRGRCASGQVSDPGVKSRNRRSAARC